MNCPDCQKDVNPKTSYGPQVFLIGFVTWIVAGFAISKFLGYSGAWGVPIALLVSSLFAKRFQVQKCPECGTTLPGTGKTEEKETIGG